MKLGTPARKRYQSGPRALFEALGQRLYLDATVLVFAGGGDTNLWTDRTNWKDSNGNAATEAPVNTYANGAATKVFVAVFSGNAFVELKQDIKVGGIIIKTGADVWVDFVPNPNNPTTDDHYDHLVLTIGVGKGDRIHFASWHFSPPPVSRLTLNDCWPHEPMVVLFHSN